MIFKVLIHTQFKKILKENLSNFFNVAATRVLLCRLKTSLNKINALE